MNVLVTGASGLIGSAVTAALGSGGHQVIQLRRDGGAGPVWDPAAGTIDLSSAPRLDAVIHLAGENVGRRWTPARRLRILRSRSDSTGLLCRTLAQLAVPPQVLVSASATGFYGDRGDDWLDEACLAGAGFLAEVCRAWEAATAPAEEAGIRVVRLRLGIVLTGQGGALAKMLPVFRLGLGGRLGDGGQYWSWIAMEDAVRVVEHALNTPGLRGPVNVTSPNPATNRDFTAALARVLRRPAFLAVPRFAVNLLFGSMGREALLASARVRPASLLGSGFQFRFPALEPALRSALGCGGA